MVDANFNARNVANFRFDLCDTCGEVVLNHGYVLGFGCAEKQPDQNQKEEKGKKPHLTLFILQQVKRVKWQSWFFERVRAWRGRRN